MPKSNLHFGIGVDMRDYNTFERALKAADPVVRKELKAKLFLAGEIVAEAARSTVDPFSTTVAQSVRVRTTGMANVAVEAAGLLGGLLELGNKGKSRGGQFRHPVFGNDVWVEQSMHPFLRDAVTKNIETVERMATSALDSAIDVIVSQS